MENKSLDLDMLLIDKKENIVLSSPLDLIMKFYNNNSTSDLETKGKNTEVYASLKWNNYSHFDVISSFWTIFQQIIKHEFNGFVAAKESYPGMYFDKKYSTNIIKNINNICNKFSDLVKLSHYCHSISNFSPCPKSPFNNTKGLLDDVQDFLPLMIDKIQDCIDSQQPMKYKDTQNKLHTVEIQTINEWHQFFLENRNSCCLDMYYSINENNKSNKIVGIKFFQKQSLSHPLPTTDEEITECLYNMISCIKLRAEKLQSIY